MSCVTLFSSCVLMRIARFKLWEDADKDLESEYTRELTKQMKPALSVLFNAFIMAQVCGGCGVDVWSDQVPAHCASTHSWCVEHWLLGP